MCEFGKPRPDGFPAGSIFKTIIMIPGDLEIKGFRALFLRAVTLRLVYLNAEINGEEEGSSWW